MSLADLPHYQLTEKVIGAAITVHRALGPGYLESIYENALRHELAKSGLFVEQQKIVDVFYDGIKVGEHRLDMVVEGCVLLELKAIDRLNPIATAQTISSLKASGFQVGLLINFNDVLLKNGLKRVILTNRGEYEVY